MDFKKIIFIMLLLSAMLILVACGDSNSTCTTHTDKNSDGKCDECGETMDVPGGDTCTQHVDANSDGKCDECGETVNLPGTGDCTQHADSDGDGKCDECGKTVETELTPCETHVDIKNDGTCDVCEQTVDDGKLQYTVYVKDENGNPVAGVKIQVCVGDSCLSVRDYMSDENGRFTRRVTNKNGETVKIMVNEASEEYDYDPTVYVASFEDGSYELELTLKKKIDAVNYTVTVQKKLENDTVATPIKDAEIEIYDGETLLKSVTTDENGVVVFALVGEYTALSAKVISTASAAVVIPPEAFLFPEGETELTIVLSATLDLPEMPF